MIATLAPSVSACPKCRAPAMSCREYPYPVLGYCELEFACIMCGLSLWPRADESPRLAYFRWLMDRWGA